MKRRLFTLAAAVSMLLFILVALAWVQSCRFGVGVAWSEVVAARGWRRTDVFGIADGRFVHWTSDSHQPGVEQDMPPQWYPIDARQRNSQSLRVDFGPRAFSFLGFGWEQGTFMNSTAPTDFYRRAAIPCWMVAGLCAIVPGLRIRAGYLRWRRGRPGRCSYCGYDLRASPGRCPECGTARQATTAAA
jgi:hypothetical protein